MLPQCSSTKTWFLTLITNYFQASQQKSLTFGLVCGIYTPFTPHLHHICTTFTPHLHPICTPLHPICIPFTSHLHPIAPHLHPICTPLHPIYIPFARPLHPIAPHARGFNGFVNIPESCDFRLKFDPLNIIFKPFFLNIFCRHMHFEWKCKE